MNLNTNHPLYSNLKFLFCVDESNNPIDLVTPSRVFTPHTNSVRGTGTWGRHFGVRRSGSSTTYGTALDAFQPANNTGTLLIVTHAIPYSAATTNASLIGGPNNPDRYLPRLSYSSAATGIVGSVRNATSGNTEFSAPSTTPYIGSTPKMWTFTRNSTTSYAIYVNATAEVTGTNIGTDNTAGLYNYIGGTPGSATLEADIVWIVWFDKVLNAAEVAELYASLGPNNQFALVDSGGSTPPTGITTITDVSPGTTTATVTYSYSAGDATGFEYRLDGGVAISIGPSPATISGLTASTPYSIEIRAINATGAGAWSDLANFFTTSGGDVDPPVLTGEVTFSSITQTSYTATYPAGSDAVAIAGYEYQINSTVGAWVDVGNTITIPISGRTAGTTETMYVRAYDAAGNRSTPPISGTVTTEAELPAGVNVTEPLKNNTGTVLANLSGIGVALLRTEDFTYGLTTNTSGILSTITDASIISGQQYYVAIKLADGGVGITGPITAT